MRLDHLSYAAGPDGLASTAKRLGGLLGKDFVDGGVHPRFGTRNMIMPMADHTYLEIVEVLDHPASDKAPFGQAVRARSALGGGWLGWVVAVDDITIVEDRLGREAANGNRYRPDGTELSWKQIGVNGLIADPQLPFFVEWNIPAELHPSHGADRNSPLPAWRSRVTRAGQRVARRDRRGAAGGHQGRVGRAPRHARHHRRPGPDPCRTGPPLRAPRPGPGRARTSGSTPRRTRSRTGRSTRTGASSPRCRRSPTGPAGTSSTSAAAPASTSPASPRAPPRWSASSRTPTWSRWPGAAPGGTRTSPSARALAEALPVPDASVDVVHARWAYFFGPGCEPGLAELDRVVRRGGTAIVDRQRPDPVDVRRLVPARVPRRSTRWRSSGSGRPAAGRGRRWTWAGRSRRGRTWRASSGSSSSPPLPRRSLPATRAPTSTTRSTSGRSSSDADDRARLHRPRLVTNRIESVQGLRLGTKPHD